MTKQQQYLYDHRTARLANLIKFKALHQIVERECVGVLLARFAGKRFSFLRMIWDLICFEAGVYFMRLRGDLETIWLRFKGWPKKCAMAISFGDELANHSKRGCHCGEDLDEFESNLRQMCRRSGKVSQQDNSI